MTRRLRLQTIAGFIGLGLLALGCTGSVGGDAPPGRDPGGNPTPGKPGGGGGVNPGVLPSDAKSEPGTVPLKRLNQLEYVNTVRDLLGLTVAPARLAAFSADQDAATSGFVAGGAVDTAEDVRVFLQAAEDLAGQ